MLLVPQLDPQHLFKCREYLHVLAYKSVPMLCHVESSTANCWFRWRKYIEKYYYSWLLDIMLVYMYMPVLMRMRSYPPDGTSHAYHICILTLYNSSLFFLLFSNTFFLVIHTPQVCIFIIWICLDSFRFAFSFDSGEDIMEILRLKLIFFGSFPPSLSPTTSLPRFLSPYHERKKKMWRFAKKEWW